VQQPIPFLCMHLQTKNQMGSSMALWEAVFLFFVCLMFFVLYNSKLKKEHK